MTAAASPPPKPSLIRIAGWAYFPIAFFARLPFAMNVVGVLTLVVAARGSISLGGLTSAAVGVGTALVGPLLGAAADRWGQRRVTLAAGIGNSLALLLMAWVAFAPVADVWILAVAVLVGATAPQVSPLSRTRLVAMIQRSVPAGRRSSVLQGTLAYESAADEVVFVFGPVIVGALATAFSPAAPMIGAAALTAVFVTAFALHRSADVVKPGQRAHEGAADPVSHLFRPGVIVVVLGMLGIGLFFGATLTSLTAFMEARGAGEQTGLLYGVMGIGSALLALSVALFPARFSLSARWIVFGVILCAGATLIGLAHDVPSMLFALGVTGIGIGPLIVNAYTLATQRTPRGRSATLMTMVGSGVIVGQSAASAIVGVMAENVGVTTALWTPAAAAALVAVAGIANAVIARSIPATRQQ